jgi:NAD(P) transhydrogenase subunit beta
VNVVLALVTVALGIGIVIVGDDPTRCWSSCSSCWRWPGVIMVLPIGGADMPVVISLLNAFTGLAVGFEGLRARATRR